MQAVRFGERQSTSNFLLRVVWQPPEANILEILHASVPSLATSGRSVASQQVGTLLELEGAVQERRTHHEAGERVAAIPVDFVGDTFPCRAMLQATLRARRTNRNLSVLFITLTPPNSALPSFA